MVYMFLHLNLKKMVGSVPPINIVITICPTIQAYRPHTSPFLPVFFSGLYALIFRYNWALKSRAVASILTMLCWFPSVYVYVYAYILLYIGQVTHHHRCRDTLPIYPKFVSRNSGLISYTQGRRILPLFFSFFY